jgi:putative endonuclease
VSSQAKRGTRRTLVLRVLGCGARDLLLNSNQSYFVYIIASRSHNLYTGVTNNLERRILEHRQGLVPGFTKRYRIHRLVYYETFGGAAIAREKQIKAWGRKKRIALIEANNPTWADLAESLFCITRKQIPRPKHRASG